MSRINREAKLAKEIINLKSIIAQCKRDLDTSLRELFTGSGDTSWVREKKAEIANLDRSLRRYIALLEEKQQTSFDFGK